MLDRVIVTFCKYYMQFEDENKLKKSIDYVNWKSGMKVACSGLQMKVFGRISFI